MYNRVILLGRLTRDPELRYTAAGKPVTNFRLAVDRGRAGDDGEATTDFVDIVAWERQAETAAEYLHKGRLVLVEGRLQVRQYEAQDKSRRTVYEVVANTVRFMPDRNGAPTEGSGAGNGHHLPREHPDTGGPPPGSTGPDDDLGY